MDGLLPDVPFKDFIIFVNIFMNGVVPLGKGVSKLSIIESKSVSILLPPAVVGNKLDKGPVLAVEGDETGSGGWLPLGLGKNAENGDWLLLELGLNKLLIMEDRLFNGDAGLPKGRNENGED